MISCDSIVCPQCDETGENTSLLGRRKFLGLVGGAAALAAANYVSPLRAADLVAPTTKPARPAEALVREFYDGLTETQRRIVVLPWDHRVKEGAQLTRLGMYNRAISQPIVRVLEPNQRELVQKIVRNICADDEGFKRISTVVTTTPAADGTASAPTSSAIPTAARSPGF